MTAEQKIDKLLEETQVLWLVKHAKNQSELEKDLAGREKDFQSRLSQVDNLSPEEKRDLLNRAAFLTIARMNPYEGKPMSEEDRQRAYLANEVFLKAYNKNDPKEIEEIIKKLKG